MRLLRLFAVACVIGSLVCAGCSTEPESSAPSSKNGGKKSGGTKLANPASGNATKEAADNPFENTGSKPGNTSAGPVAATPNSWCATAAKTTIVKDPKHAEQFAQLCTGNGTATQRFIDLLKQPYQGSGTPAAVAITPIAASNGQVSGFMASSMKLPINSEKHFTVLAPKEGEVENQKAQASFQGQTPGNIVITPLPKGSDTGWDRGWRIDRDGSQKVSVMTIKITYSDHAEHYNLGNGHYMYVSTLVESKSTIRDYRVLSAMIDIEGKAHIASIVNVVGDDYGAPASAKTSITTTLSRTLQYLYNGAVALSK